MVDLIGPVSRVARAFRGLRAPGRARARSTADQGWRAPVSLGMREQRRPVSMGDPRGQRRALFAPSTTLLAILLGIASLPAGAATPAGTQIDNVAEATWLTGGAQSTTSNVVSFVTESLGVPPTALVFDDTTITSGVAGDTVGAFTVTDADAGDTFTITVDDPRFVVDADPGDPARFVLRLAGGVAVDGDTEPAVTPTLTVTDSFGNTYAQAVPVTVVTAGLQPGALQPGRCPIANGPNALADGVGPFRICETVTGATVGKFSDVLAGTTWAVSDARFTVTEAGLVRLRSDVALDHETEASIPLTVTATLPGGGTRTTTLDLLVDDVNERPAITVDARASVPEQVPGLEIGPVNTSDPDLGDPLTVTVDDDRFEVVDGILRLRAGVELSFEAEPVVQFRVKVTDAAGLAAETRITLQVEDRNEPPSADPLDVGVALGTAAGTVIGQVTGRDDDTDAGLSYTADGAPAALAVDPADGRIRVVDPSALGPAGTVYRFTVRVSDGEAAADAPVIVRVVADNTPPFVEPQRFEPVPEITTSGRVVGTVGALDVDEPLLYAITGGDPRGVFAIDPATGRITVARPALLDHESTPEIALQVSVTDSHPTPLTSVATITIPVADVNEPPRVVTEEIVVPPGAALGDVLGRIEVVDPDTRAGDAARVSIVEGDPNGALAVDPVTGTIKVVNLALLEFDENGVATLVVRAEDGNASGSANGRQSTEAVIVLRREDLNRAPTAVRLDDTAVPAGTPGAVVGDLSAEDPDVGDTHEFLVNDARFLVEAGPDGPRLRLAPGVSLADGERAVVAITAIDPAGLSVTRRFTVHTGDLARNPATISFLHAPLAVQAGPRAAATPLAGAAIERYDVGQSQCVLGDPLTGDFVASLTPRSLGDAALPIPGAIDLVEVDSYKIGEPLFVRVTDLDGDRDPAVRDRVTIDLVVDGSQDSESLRLTETGPSTGEFIGYIQSTNRSNGPYDCVLWVGGNVTLTATYFDEEDGTDTAAAAALVDPFGFVFASGSGRRIDGAVVRLVDAETGEPATVFGDEPFGDFPAEIVSGGRTTDAAGVVYDFPAGAFRYPFVNPGRFRLQVDPPNRFSFPSEAADGALENLPGGPYRVVEGSRGEVFEVPVGPALRIDLPLDVEPLAPTDARLETFALAAAGAPSSAVEDVLVQRTRCLAGDRVRILDLPRGGDGGFIDLPGRVSLVPATAYGSGDTVFLRLTDRDEDRDPFAPDVIELSLATTAADGERERVRLTETGASTGVFTGYLTSSTRARSGGDCALGADEDRVFDVDYVDADDAADTAGREIVFDPSGLVFDALTGEPLNGVDVTIVDADTGAPATVFATDGVTRFPSTVTTGGRVTDDDGRTIAFEDGRFRFPVVPAGTYRYEVETERELVFPSTVDDEQLQQLEGAPFRLDGGSRGEAFRVVPGQLNVRDLPLDPVAAEIFLSKKALSPVAAIGDFVQYEITAQNAGAVDAGEIVLRDTLPLGFRYQGRSARVAGEPLPDVTVGEDGRSLAIPVPPLALGETFTVRYVAAVTAGAKLGDAVNRVTATGPRVRRSNTAEATVRVREDLLRSKAILMGRVLEGDCETPIEERSGMAGVRLYMEDGTYVVTDSEGRWHVEGVEPGTHVLQLDEATLPESHRPVQCEENTRSAGSDISRFVDVQGGTLWREDFHVTLKPPVTGQVRQRFRSRLNGERVLYRLEYSGERVPLDGFSSITMLPDGVAYEPGSLRIDGAPADDPSGAEGGSLTVRLGDLPASFSRTLTFMGRLEPGIEPGEHVTKTTAMFATAGEKRVRTPIATTKLLVDGPEAVEGGDVLARIDAADADAAGRLASLADRLPADAELAVRADAADLTPALRTAIEARGLTVLPPGAASGGAGAGAPAVDGGGVVELVARRAAPRLVTLEDAGGGLGTVEVTGAVPGLGEEREIDPVTHLEAEMPEFDAEWLVAQDTGSDFAWPPATFNPRVPSIPVVVKHPASAKVRLEVDGDPVPGVAFDGRVRDPQRDVAVSKWRGVPIGEGTTRVTAVLLDQQNAEIARLEREVVFAGGVYDAELVPEASNLVADGMQVPWVALRLTDRDGNPVRTGSMGTYRVDAPYTAYRTESARNDLSRQRESGNSGTMIVDNEGIGRARLTPTTEVGEVVVRVELANGRSEDFRVRLQPAYRDWILVGFAEGTAAYQTLSGNMRDAREAGHLEDLSTDGRVAFFAKGTVKGEYLLTLAYDSDKAEERLGRQIDPERFYTLYGDASEQQYDAESREKLYLRLENETFSALFGDYTTALGDSEFGRYSRRLTGTEFTWRGETLSVTAFGAETETAFVQDELRGDGTSGLYRLSGEEIVVNSERVRIEVRDRLHPERVVEERTLSRFVDYQIDYDRGTLLFKEPVLSQDADFNPRFIVVDYETSGRGDGRTDLVVGGRVAAELADGAAEVGANLVHDGTRGAESGLAAVDGRWRVTESVELRAEAAYTMGESDDEDRDGLAWKVEAERTSGDLLGRAYVRQQDDGFGFGQQSGGGTGARKYGLEVSQRLGEQFTVESEAWNETILATGSERSVGEAQLAWKRDATELRGGARWVQQTDAEGVSSDANQLTTSARRDFWDGRLSTQAGLETAIGGSDNRDFPTRATVGGDIDVTRWLGVYGRQAYTFADDGDALDSVAGLRLKPFGGTELTTDVNRERTPDAERLFQTLGLTQQWRLNDHWSLDAGFDAERTLDSQLTARPVTAQALRDDDADPTDLDQELRDPVGFDPTRPPANGAAPERDFIAGFLGVGYRRDVWDATGRLEHRTADDEDKWNLKVGIAHQIDDGRILSAGIEVLDSQSAAETSTSASARLSLAWRPTGSAWVFLDRLDLVSDERSGSGLDFRERKFVNNLNASWRPNARNQLALQWGVKYVLDDIDGQRYSELTNLLGAEYRYDVTRRWDVGLHMNFLHSWEARVLDWRSGVSVGHTPMHNVWVSAGWNFSGFRDEDFTGADHTAQGPFVKFRMKVDQHSLRDYLGEMPFRLD
jgi:uncharacterized repeat protein (TIGR01451 family)